MVLKVDGIDVVTLVNSASLMQLLVDVQQQHTSIHFGVILMHSYSHVGFWRRATIILIFTSFFVIFFFNYFDREHNDDSTIRVHQAF
jgi:hypothetical protein